MKLLTILSSALALTLPALEAADPIRVLVWDEQQPSQKKVYPDFLGEHLAAHLRSVSGRDGVELEIRTARLDDPEQGLSAEVLDETDVLLWWGHVRHDGVSRAQGADIIRRVREGTLAYFPLHSAHWAVPFMEAMEQKAEQDALERLSPEMRAKAKVRFLGDRLRVKLSKEARQQLDVTYQHDEDGVLEVLLERPNCVFPVCCDPVEPSTTRTLLPKHPIARGVPQNFVLPKTEMYDAPFHVPAPDQLIFEERWEGGEVFPSGALWKIGRGEVFYFRPGHETYPVFHEKPALRIVENAVRYLGENVQARIVDAKKASRLSRALVFSKTSWYRHPAIPEVNEWFVKLGKAEGFLVDVTEDSALFTPEKLAGYEIVVLNSTTDIGKSFDDAQKKAIRDWYAKGGGIVGIHAAVVHHGTWPWFEKLAGTDFTADSKRLRARLFVDPEGHDHPSVRGAGPVFWLEEEWNNFRESVRGLPGVKILLRLDETSYEPVRPHFQRQKKKPMGADHPIAWLRVHEGGRFFYTGLGHDTRSLSTDFGRRHVLAGLRWAAGERD